MNQFFAPFLHYIVVFCACMKYYGRMQIYDAKTDDISFEYSSGSRQMFENHYHNEIEIYFLITGQRYYFIENGTHLVMSGNLVIIREGVPHKVFSAGFGYFERYILYVSRAFVEESFDDEEAENIFRIFDSDKFVYRLRAPARAENIFHEMNAEHLTRPNSAQEYKLLKKLATDLLMEIKDSVQGEAASGPETSYVNKNILQVAGYINKHFSDKITLDILASKFNLSKYYLCKLFKSSFGLTFSDFLNHVRIMEAKKMLETTDMNVSDISRKSGYSDIAYFCRVFKKVMGVSALRFKKAQNPN